MMSSRDHVSCPYAQAAAQTPAPGCPARNATPAADAASSQDTKAEREAFLRACSQELPGAEQQHTQRRREIARELQETGTWTPQAQEIALAAKLAWRNSNRCIGRLHWKSLHSFDRRDLQHIDDVADALLQHLRFATNGGRIRSAISVFSNEFRILNPQLIRYAGFLQEDGRVLGDPLMLNFTRRVMTLGWQPPRRDAFTLLPLVVQQQGKEPKFFPLPDDDAHALEVPILHPELDFEPLGLKWHALPVISDMRLEFGGLSYGAAPFNGYYMGTEIGARNLGDTARYNKLPEVAGVMGLDIKKPAYLWKDRAMTELNIAVLHSFEQAGVKMLDHYTASEQFMQFSALETQKGREVTGEWSWLVPPVSGSASPIFHQEWKTDVKTPAYTPVQNPWMQ